MTRNAPEPRLLRIIPPSTVRGIVEAVGSSETVRRAESLRRNPMYTLSQLFAANVVRDAGRIPYGGMDEALTDGICEALDLPKRRDGTYRRPSVGRLSRFVLEDWPKCSDGFTSEFATAVIEDALGRGGQAVITLDSFPLKASDFNRDADVGSNHAGRMDKAHIAAIGGIPLFCIRTGGSRSDCAVAGELCRMLRGTDRLRGSGARISMDAGYCTFDCLVEAFLTTGSRPHVVLRKDSVPHPDAAWEGMQARYCRMFGSPDYDPYGKDDEGCVLPFLCRHGAAGLVGRYLLNREIERQLTEPAFDGADLDGSGRMHRAMAGPIPFDIIGVEHGTRGAVIAFRFNAIQVLSRISSDAVCRGTPGLCLHCATRKVVFNRMPSWPTGAGRYDARS